MDNKLINVQVHAELTLRLRKPPPTIKHLIRSLEIIKDKYQGLVKNEQLVRFFIIATGYLAKYKSELGGYLTYFGTIHGPFKLYIDREVDSYPFFYTLNCEDTVLHPDVIISFNLEMRKTKVTTQSFVPYLISHGPTVYAKRHVPKLSIYSFFDLSVSIYQDQLYLKNQ